MSPRRITVDQSIEAAHLWVTEHRPSYDSTARHWLVDALARAIRAGVDDQLIAGLVQGAELAAEAHAYRRRLERGEEP